MLAHLLVAGVAALVTVAITPLIARLSRRVGAMAAPVDAVADLRADGRARPGAPAPGRRTVPTLGGLGMLAGFLAAMGTASLLPGFEPLFTRTSEPIALVVGAILIVAVGVADDLWGLPPPIKLAGQIVASLGVVLLGIQLVRFWLPGLDVLVLSADLGMLLTIIALVAMINALNLIDGMDGLAAGIAAIAAIAFFLFAVRSSSTGLVEAVPTSATLVAAIVAGIALGFLAHNWHPARIFMGDTGAMLLGLLLGAAGVAYVGRSTAPSSVDFYGSIPLIVPALVLAVPFLDSAFAVVRRLLRRAPITLADRGHLHHLLLTSGHPHRRAVLVLYYWSAVVAFGSVAPAFMPVTRVVPWVVGAAAVGVLLTIVGPRRRGVEATTPEASAPHSSAG